MPHTRQSAAERAYAELREMILRGDLSGGENLRTAALQEQFGFGATPLREALNRLSAEHLVTLTFNQGFKVSPLSLDELEDLDRTRSLLEIEMLIASIRAGTEDWESRIVASHYQLGKQKLPTIGSDAERIEQWDNRHQAFHDALIAASGSHWMKVLLEKVETQRRRYHLNILRHAQEDARARPETRDGMNEVLAQAMGPAAHTPLMEATLDRDEETARSLMANHIRLTSDAYQAIQAILPDHVRHQYSA